MTLLIENLHDATVVKRFLDELEKNPKRTLGALLAVLLLTGAGVTAAYRTGPVAQRPLSELPIVPATQDSMGNFQKLPQAMEAEKQLQSTLSFEEQRDRAIIQELKTRKDNAPVTEREVRLLNETGQVPY